MALLVWQDRLRDYRKNLKFTQGFAYGGCLKYMVQRIPLAFNIQPTNMFKHLISSDRISIIKHIKGDRLLFPYELSTSRVNPLPCRKSSLSPFFLLFLLRKKDTYKHVDLV